MPKTISKVASVEPNMGITMRCPSDIRKNNLVASKSRAGSLQLEASSKILSLLNKSVTGQSKKPEITFGKNPSIRYGVNESKLSITAEETWQEFYRHGGEGDHGLKLDGFVTHRVQVKYDQAPVRSNDAATLLFQAQLAALDQKKKANQTGFDKLHLAQVPDKRKGAAKNVRAPTAGQAKKGLGSNALSFQAPALAMSPKSSFPQLPASLIANMVDEKAVKMLVIRNPILHLLAVEAMHISKLASKLSVSVAECREILNKHGKPVNGMADHWVPTDRAYKLLDIWKFAYPRAEDRERAISNAISAFDRLRLSREDPLWQMLLREEERGKGIVLSRLNLHLPPGMRPAPTPTLVPGSSPPVAGSGTDSSPAGKSTQPTQKKPGRQPANAPRNLNSLFGKKKKPTGTTTATKKTTATKTQTKKNDNENFKSAEYVHSSDEDSTDELFKELPAPKPATPKVSAGTKRKANEVEPTPSTNDNKRHQSSPPSSLSTRTPTSRAKVSVGTKRKVDEVEPTPSTNDNKRHQSSPPSSLSTPTPTSRTVMDNTPSTTNSGKYSPKGFELELILKGIEYQDRFPEYARLWDEVQAMAEPSKEKMDELEKMHLELKALKHEMEIGAKQLQDD